MLLYGIKKNKIVSLSCHKDRMKEEQVGEEAEEKRCIFNTSFIAGAIAGSLITSSLFIAGIKLVDRNYETVGGEIGLLPLTIALSYIGYKAICFVGDKEKYWIENAEEVEKEIEL